MACQSRHAAVQPDHGTASRTRRCARSSSAPVPVHVAVGVFTLALVASVASAHANANSTTMTPTPPTDEDNGTMTNSTAALLASGDLSAIFYLHYNAGVIIPPLEFPPHVNVTLPSQITDRLEPFNLTFLQLDGFLQRALLWDAGYIYAPPPVSTPTTTTPLPSPQQRRSRRRTLSALPSSSSSSSSSSTTRSSPFLKVYTRNGIDMSAIAPSRNDMETSSCGLQLCSSENYGTTWRAGECSTVPQLLAAVRCAIDVSDVPDDLLPSAPSDGRQRTLWTAFNAEDRDKIPDNIDLATPDINVAFSEWTDTDDTRDAGVDALKIQLYTIHTVPFADEPPIGQCPSNRTDARGDLLPTLTIPCASYAQVVSSSSSSRLLQTSEWKRPTASPLVTTWLETVAPKSASGSPATRAPNNKPSPSSPSSNNLPPGANNLPPGTNNASTSNGGFNLVNLVPIVLGALALVAVAIGFVTVRRRRSSSHTSHHTKPTATSFGSPFFDGRSSKMTKHDDGEGYFDGAAFLSPPATSTQGSSYPYNHHSHRSHDNLAFDMDSGQFSVDSSAHTLSGGASGLGLPLSIAPRPATARKDSTELGVVPETASVQSSRSRPRSFTKSLAMATLRRHTSEPTSFDSSGAARPSLDTEHLKLLQTDPNLSASRVSYDKIVFDRILSRSTRYEVWLGQYEGEEIAVKRLARRRGSTRSVDDDRNTIHDIETNLLLEAFVAEIQITASLDHPNLARFVGVAWFRLPADSLCLVTEYQPNGDLRQYLELHYDDLTWPRQKKKWAIGVASALQYLHEQRPAVLHLELNSCHVLLSDRLQPKLIDFGERPSSDDWTQLRRSGDDLIKSTGSSSSSPGAFPYWVAPEVLRGDGHTTAADVYAFGMLLAELDTGRVPLSDAKNETNGNALKPLQVLNLVVAGRLQPSVTSLCPISVRELVDQCTHAETGQRPTMRQVLRALELADFHAAL